MTNTTNNPTIPTTSELPMTSSTMPFHWEMFQLIRHNTYAGNHFFSLDTMRFFRSRYQGVPPYKGRVFVTSEKSGWNAPRYYTVRCIRPDGGIDTIGEFQGFSTRYDAHSFAKAYAAQNFVRVGNASIQIPPETNLV